MSNVKNYTDEELLNKARVTPNFKGFPAGYWILGVQSNEDEFNKFDDKFYLFKGTIFIMVTGGTTNAGLAGLSGYKRYNDMGCAVIKTDEWYHGLWRPGKHRGKMKALRQVRRIKYFRDYNMNKNAEQIGPTYSGLIGINFHTVSYQKKAGFIRNIIGGWSVGCQVVNDVEEYYKILKFIGTQKDVTYCLIKEF